MKTIDIQIQEKPLEFMRKLYSACLQTDKTFHFVIWSDIKWKGRKFDGTTVLLRVDNARVKKISTYLDEYYGAKYTVYDFPSPKGKFQFGLGKKSIERKFPDEFNEIYHLYSVLSLKIEKGKERENMLMQLMHIPLNVFQYSFIREVLLYQYLSYKKLELLDDKRIK